MAPRRKVFIEMGLKDLRDGLSLVWGGPSFPSLQIARVAVKNQNKVN